MKTEELDVQQTVPQVYLTKPWKWFPSGLPHPQHYKENEQPQKEEPFPPPVESSIIEPVSEIKEEKIESLSDVEKENLQSNSIRNKLKPYYPPSIVFGQTPDQFALKESLFINIKKIPHTLFKFDGENWIEVSKVEYSTYLDNKSYVKFLKDEHESGKYDFQFLTEHEAVMINAKKGKTE